MAKAKANLFTAARSNPSKKAGPSKPKDVKVPTADLEAYAFLDALEKQAKALKEALKPSIETQMTTQFLANRGENYKGEESSASASLECRKRSSASGFKDHELPLIEKYGISTVRIEGEFKINVVGVSEEKLQEVSDAISKIKGLPEDFIELDASKARTITTETSIKDVFKLNDLEVQRQLLPIVATYAIKPKTRAKMSKILTTVAEMVEDEEEA